MNIVETHFDQFCNTLVLVSGLQEIKLVGHNTTQEEIQMEKTETRLQGKFETGKP